MCSPVQMFLRIWKHKRLEREHLSEDEKNKGLWFFFREMIHQEKGQVSRLKSVD